MYSFPTSGKTCVIKSKMIRIRINSDLTKKKKIVVCFLKLILMNSERSKLIYEWIIGKAKKKKKKKEKGVVDYYRVVNVNTKVMGQAGVISLKKT